MKLRKGMKIGLKVVQRVFLKGPFTYCVMRCQCGNLAVIPAIKVVRGAAISCRQCWNKAKHDVVNAAVAELCKSRQAEAAAIRKRFGIKEGKVNA